MKILHIGDIHLGCTLENFRRNKEISLVFKEIVHIVKLHQVKAALLAGDIFDSGTPSNESQELYYEFLVDLNQAGCTQLVIIAGNHDNPNFLEAPGTLLKKMNIHVIGNVDPDHLEKEIIALYEDRTDPVPGAVICAVPHLRERDVRTFVAEGESFAEKNQAFHAGVVNHYAKVTSIARELYPDAKIPLIGMGHLYLQGSTLASYDENSRVPVGNLDPVDLTTVTDRFAYMALGHIHRPQCAGGNPLIRYAGSILPMNLLERPVKPQVILLDTEKIDSPLVLELPEKCFHKMCVVKGDMNQLREQLHELQKDAQPVWVKPVYTGNEVLPNWVIDLQQEFRESSVQIVAAETRRQVMPGKAFPGSGDPEEERSILSKLTPEEVFLAHLEKKGEVTADQQKEQLLALYRSAQNEVLAPEEQAEKNTLEAPLHAVMKFKRLFIRNVNSLYGEHLIDFEAEDFQSGIFLISGNTGAGKSSIMDAITLALYGCTPRVSKISDTQNSVMSEGTTSMAAELTFSVGETEYRAVFRHARAGAKAQKKFRTPEHKLYIEGKEAAVSGKRGTQEEIIKLTGMDNSQFTRCVLLAQGSFDAFLKSKVSDRSEILKHITGTDIYTRIGQKINEKFSLIKEEYSHCSKLLEGITLLPPEEVAKLEESFLLQQKELTALENQLQLCRNAEDLCKRILQTQEGLETAKEKAHLASEARKEAAPRYETFADASRALHCQKAFDDLCTVEKFITQLQDTLKQLENDSAGLVQANTSAQADCAQQEKVLAELEQSSVQARALFQEVKDLDSVMESLQKQKTASLQKIRTLQAQQKNVENEYAKASNRFKVAETQAESAKQYLIAHPGDDSLEARQMQWELKRQNLAREEKILSDRKKFLAGENLLLGKQAGALANLQKEISSHEAALRETEQKYKILQDREAALSNGKTLEEIRLAWASAGKLSDFFKGNVQRKDFLTPGAACPLCGSHVHPYCEGTPVPGEASSEANTYSQTAEMLKKRLTDLETCQKSLHSCGVTLENLNQILREKKQSLQIRQEEYAEKQKVLEQEQTQYARLKAELEQGYASLGEEISSAVGVPFNDHTKLPDELQQRIDFFLKARKVCDALDQERLSLEQAFKVYQSTLAQVTEQRTLEEQNLQTLTKEWESHSAARQEKFGTRNVFQEEETLLRTLDESRKRCSIAREKVIKSGEALAHNRNDIQSARQKLHTRQEELQACRNDFETSLQKHAFTSREEFLLKRMDGNALRLLGEELQKLDLEEKTLLTIVQERQNLLCELKKELSAEFDREENLALLDTLLHSLDDQRNSLTQIQIALAKDKEDRSRHEKTAVKLEETRLLFNDWKYLNDNFGSTPGPDGTDRFGRIAQGYTFRELLYYANANRLGSLKEHFTLVGDEEDPLELNVIDHYRGDLVRTSRNLSGGESFEVSLALALGLSEMSGGSQHARLGNVLLDEGFGTLDEKALESALALLMQLKHSGGKLVGIISHVEKLREQILAQIEVTNVGGMGILSGSGVISAEELKQRRALESPEEVSALRRTRKKKKESETGDLLPD